MNKKHRAVKLLTIFTVIIMSILIIVLACQTVKIANLKSKENHLRQEREFLVSEIYNFNTANNYYSNNREEYLENYARDMLGWGENGEIWYTKG